MQAATAISNNDRAAAIINSLGEPAIVLDERGAVTLLNQMAADILGMEYDDILGRVFDDNETETGLSYVKVRAALKAAACSSTSTQTELQLKARGREQAYLMRSAPLQTGNEGPVGTLIIFRELPNRQERRGPLHGTVAAAAHELNTPLTSMSLAFGLLQRNLDRQHELVEVVLEDIERINRASKGLVNVIQERPRSIPIRAENCNVAKILTFVVHKFEKLIARKNVTLTLQTEEDIEASGDPKKLTWLVAILVSNALRFTPAGGAIGLFARSEGAEIKVSVTDTGPGMPMEVVDSIFRAPLLRPSDLVRLTGATLGLAKEIVEAHGGDLLVETPVNGGSVLTFTLPLSQDT